MVSLIKVEPETVQRQ